MINLCIWLFQVNVLTHTADVSNKTHYTEIQKLKLKHFEQDQRELFGNNQNVDGVDKRELFGNNQNVDEVDNMHGVDSGRSFTDDNGLSSEADDQNENYLFNDSA
jgi:lysine-specific demethylase 3